MVYRIADGSTMQTTDAQNVAALQDADLKAAGSGKLADSDIRALCAGQYKVIQGAADGRVSPNMPLFCRYDNIDTYGDDVWNSANKKCSLTYSADAAAYTKTPSSQSWNYGLSTWGVGLGSTILQLRYGDTRLERASPRSGSHAATYDHATQKNVCGTGTCRTQVWCKSDPATFASASSCQAVRDAGVSASGPYEIALGGVKRRLYCDLSKPKAWTRLNYVDGDKVQHAADLDGKRLPASFVQALWEDRDALGWSDSATTMHTQESWLLRDPRLSAYGNDLSTRVGNYYAKYALNTLRAWGNVLNGKTPTGTASFASYEGAYLKFSGTLATFGDWKSMYVGCSWSSTYTVGDAAQFRTGGTRNHVGEYIHSNCGGYKYDGHSITARPYAGTSDSRRPAGGYPKYAWISTQVAGGSDRRRMAAAAPGLARGGNTDAEQ
jgi:hypothetical protein